MLVDLRAAVDDALQGGARKNPVARGAATAAGTPGSGKQR
jgi:hypothetical protein